MDLSFLFRCGWAGSGSGREGAWAVDLKSLLEQPQLQAVLNGAAPI